MERGTELSQTGWEYTHSPAGRYSNILYIKNSGNPANMSAVWVKTDMLSTHPYTANGKEF